MSAFKKSMREARPGSSTNHKTGNQDGCRKMAPNNTADRITAVLDCKSVLTGAGGRPHLKKAFGRPDLAPAPTTRQATKRADETWHRNGCGPEG
ncbi:hypothetical protein NDU88_006474 [Pleurodeles waltl]|uniref:Uncharacterized protein n=1 Tax=Pleurodeles waltl TaxID=8319 RepID=A0AAV7WAQ9_PLEWA|nr:hypothetical protein NDU88_006474 [Pleurodeles waltl]